MGPKTEADLAPAPKVDKKATKKPDSKSSTNTKKDTNNDLGYQPLTIHDVMKKVDFHLPGENYKTDGYVVTENTQKLLAKHLKETGGKVSIIHLIYFYDFLFHI